ncbi:MAG TPA: tetratricopeptide repeat protein [Candidatus Obscuribacterales bacterium]
MSILKSPIHVSAVLLAFSLNLGISVEQATAEKLNVAPLPHERDLKDFQGGQSVIIPPSATRFQRRPDYREEERLKKEADAEAAKRAEQAKKDAAEAAKRAQQQQIENYQKYLQMAVDANNRAVLLGKQNRWTEAIAEHEKAVQYDPRNKQFRINLSAARTAFAQQRMAAGDYSGASHMLRKALCAASDNALAGKLLADSMKKQGLDPGSPDVRLELSDKLANANDLEGAAIEANAAMQLENSARTLVKMGDIAYRYGQVQAAMGWYRQAIVKDADYGPAHRQLGFLQMTRNDLTAAAASLRKAVICDSKDTAAGQALVEIWRKQVAQNPLLAENHLGLAGALQLTGDFVGAETEYRKLEALEPKNPSLESGRASLARAMEHARAEKHKAAADTFFGQGLRREALIEVSQAIRIEPRNAKYQYLLGECLEALGDYSGAYKAYLTCVLIDPEFKEAAARMRELQQQTKMSSDSIGQIGGQVASQLTAPQASAPSMVPAQLPAQPQPMQQTMQQSMQQPAMQPQATGNQPVAQQAVVHPGSFRVAPVEQPVQENVGYPRKNMFEGNNGAPAAVNPQAFDFRTHDESTQQEAAQERAQAAAQASPIAAAQAARPQETSSTADGEHGAMTVGDTLAKVTYLESQRDYAGAAELIKQAMSGNLQNPELHHRLAVNLMAAGQISEAVSEFRIASALAPAKKMYSDDLARALAIHKRSLMSEKGDPGAGR